jgi:hypothetical protein
MTSRHQHVRSLFWPEIFKKFPVPWRPVSLDCIRHHPVCCFRTLRRPSRKARHWRGLLSSVLPIPVSVRGSKGNFAPVSGRKIPVPSAVPTISGSSLKRACTRGRPPSRCGRSRARRVGELRQTARRVKKFPETTYTSARPADPRRYGLGCGQRLCKAIRRTALGRRPFLRPFLA